ncbi:MAG: RDD family protein [Thermoanaerobaculia bacterium]|nr:RDD family protein [Thermoanaerobaculia bacterium]
MRDVKPQEPLDPTGHGSAAEVLGLDNVALDLTLAGLGSRLLAMVLDMIVVLLLCVLVTLGILLIADTVGLPGDWTAVLIIFLLFFFQWAYFSVCELLMDGRTPGKSLVGLRTVTSLGGRPSLAAVMVRNLLRLIDMLLGWPLIALDRRSRRLGDLLASTLVVHHRQDEHGIRLGSVPSSWGSREVAVVESFLRRARRMESEQARTLAERLLDWMRRREPAFLAQRGLDTKDLPADFIVADPVALLGELLQAERA